MSIYYKNERSVPEYNAFYLNSLHSPVRKPSLVNQQLSVVVKKLDVQKRVIHTAYGSRNSYTTQGEGSSFVSRQFFVPGNKLSTTQGRSSKEEKEYWAEFVKHLERIVDRYYKQLKIDKHVIHVRGINLPPSIKEFFRKADCPALPEPEDSFSLVEQIAYLKSRATGLKEAIDYLRGGLKMAEDIIVRHEASKSAPVLLSSAPRSVKHTKSSLDARRSALMSHSVPNLTRPSAPVCPSTASPASPVSTVRSLPTSSGSFHTSACSITKNAKPKSRPPKIGVKKSSVSDLAQPPTTASPLSSGCTSTASSVSFTLPSPSSSFRASTSSTVKNAKPKSRPPKIGVKKPSVPDLTQPPTTASPLSAGCTSTASPGSSATSPLSSSFRASAESQSLPTLSSTSPALSPSILKRLEGLKKAGYSEEQLVERAKKLGLL